LYFVPGPGRIALIFALCHHALGAHIPTAHSTTISRFWCNFFPEWPLNFFVRTIHQVIWPSPGTARSREDETLHSHWNTNEILDCESLGLFSNEPYERKPVMTIEDFVLYSNDHFESHLLGNGLYLRLAWDRLGFLHWKDPTSKMQMGQQRAVAGVGTSKSEWQW